MIGNSSSGILEVPYFQKPTINIGKRQEGRLKASSVVDCELNSEAIIEAVNGVLSEDFKLSLRTVQQVYGERGASLKIAQVLKQTDFGALNKKKFYDIEISA